MDYIAKAYVMHNGRMYTPGELIDAKLPKETIESLFERNAIESVTGAEDADISAAVAVEDVEPVEESSYDDADEESIMEVDIMDGIVQPAETAKKGRKKK